ncbi:YrdB family protein [Streptomyces hydrogenans]|uniref:YrdB family protein n=1 Tax=Streptomyces TaxID=1883 RepID=UPI0027E4A6DE|nr:YrdB family protein [Streptomyces sp. G2]
MFSDLLAFVLEMAALGFLAWWGWSAVDPVALRVALAVAVPGAAATVWGLFAAPKARFRVPVAGVLVVKALVFGGAALALSGVGHGTAAVVFAVVAAVNTAMVTVSRRSGGGLAVR